MMDVEVQQIGLKVLKYEVEQSFYPKHFQKLNDVGVGEFTERVHLSQTQALAEAFNRRLEFFECNDTARVAVACLKHPSEGALIDK